MIFIGIDLAWTPHKETGICVLSQSGEVLTLCADSYSIEDIIRIITSYHPPLSIGIDAPLIVKNETGAREAERLLMKTKIHGYRQYAFIANRHFLKKTYGEIRGEILLHALKEAYPDLTLHLSKTKTHVIETFPTSITCGLFPEYFPFRYKQKRHVSFNQSIQGLQTLCDCLLSQKGPYTLYGCNSLKNIDWTNLTRHTKKHIEDQLDALLCAYGLYTLFHDLSTPLLCGVPEDGAIVIPIKEHKNTLDQ
ncbi:Uncharacterized protein conserved in bacteria [Staphylococcus agnetis]|uniref:DUF429 domain-containing protein n=1 Tax=Staphylococcus agnetis TaxID=985762 RepID=UPI000E00E195|nr:DUF429 domain-containing protein [Staphylococcus agnetis]SUK04888.1 Uncharacterized protein conserved in bacteria [Staphylococcus agnetis]